ncbi:MAG: hypothetical protein ACRC33_14310 [Gemmataceae bacterium]
MSGLTGEGPIGDDEVVYRRIPVSTRWYVPGQPAVPQAFRPRNDDTTGLSLVRAEPFNTPEQAGRGPSKQGYFVAALRVRDIRQYGMDVVSRPVPGINGHVEIPELTLTNRDEPEGIGRANVLASLCFEFHGPFVPPGA